MGGLGCISLPVKKDEYGAESIWPLIHITWAYGLELLFKRARILFEVEFRYFIGDAELLSWVLLT